jgi:HAD superfamily hydrolase (TIGR01509 family)
LELIIFDCDGVLVDSETIACRIVAECLARDGFSITWGDVAEQFVGVPDREMYAELERQHDRPIAPALRQRVTSEVRVALSNELEPTEGVHEALQSIETRKCVASSSSAERVRACLQQTGLLDFFAPHIFTTNEVKRGKPAPDLFLHAAHQLQVAPGRCVVVEDSRAGVQAGRAAGMRVLGYTGASHCSDGHGEALRRDGAVTIFGDMQDLPKLLKSLA